MLKIGDKLPNGAVVLDIGEQDGHTIILCLRLRGVEYKLHPFVTWGYEPQGGTYWGHYAQTLSEAIVDFNERTQ